MKIIEPGVIPEPKIYNFTCNYCGCIFECYEDECNGYAEDEGGHYFTWYMTHECPTCHIICYAKHD